MPQSLDKVLIHVVFSTKDRFGCLGKSLRPRLHGYLATLIRDLGCGCPCVGGVGDHVHLAVTLSRSLAIADLVKDIKSKSSQWIKNAAPDLDGFAWQRGYGVFSVGPSDERALCAYIENQEEHHQQQSFQDEFRKFLAKYGIEYDERYVWD